MLIQSPRHRPEDLRLWMELEAADIAYRLSPGLATQTIEAIRAWAVGLDCHVDTSWGKDSVVMLHLLTLSGIRVPVVYVRLRNSRDNPDCEFVRDAFLSRFPVDYYERWFTYEDCPGNKHWRAVDVEFGPRRMTGLRADESGLRRLSIRRLGIDSGKSFRPIAHWKITDVFAYLAQEGLPVHSAYACLGGGRWPREHLRTHSIGGKRGTGMGRREWEQEYYPEQLRRIG